MKKKTLAVFTVPWDEIYEEFGYYDMPTEKVKNIMDEMLPSDKLGNAERGKLLKALAEGRPLLKVADLTNHGVEFTFCYTKKTQEAQPSELAGLKARQEKAFNEIFASYRRGEIPSEELSEHLKKVGDDTGIKVMTLDEDFIFCRFGSFFGLKAWREPDTIEGYAKLKPAISRKITKVELTKDGIEFTTVRV